MANVGADRSVISRHIALHRKLTPLLPTPRTQASASALEPSPQSSSFYPGLSFREQLGACSQYSASACSADLSTTAKFSASDLETRGVPCFSATSSLLSSSPPFSSTNDDTDGSMVAFRTIPDSLLARVTARRSNILGGEEPASMVMAMAADSRLGGCSQGDVPPTAANAKSATMTDTEQYRRLLVTSRSGKKGGLGVTTAAPSDATTQLEPPIVEEKHEAKASAVSAVAVAKERIAPIRAQTQAYLADSSTLTRQLSSAPSLNLLDHCLLTSPGSRRISPGSGLAIFSSRRAYPRPTKERWVEEHPLKHQQSSPPTPPLRLSMPDKPHFDDSTLVEQPFTKRGHPKKRWRSINVSGSSAVQQESSPFVSSPHSSSSPYDNTDDKGLKKEESSHKRKEEITKPTPFLPSAPFCPKDGLPVAYASVADPFLHLPSTVALALAEQKLGNRTETLRSTEGTRNLTLAVNSAAQDDHNDETSKAKNNAVQEAAKADGNKKRKRKPYKKKPVDMPRRPLSAYNLFFSDERNRILKALKEKDEGSVVAAVLLSSSSEPSSPKSQSQFKSRPPVLSRSLTRTPRTRRPHRRTHGRIGFKDLARTIAARWKALPPSRLEYYQSLAQNDRERHREAMAEYRRGKEREEAEHQQKQLQQEQKQGQGVAAAASDPSHHHLIANIDAGSLQKLVAAKSGSGILQRHDDFDKITGGGSSSSKRRRLDSNNSLPPPPPQGGGSVSNLAPLKVGVGPRSGSIDVGVEEGGLLALATTACALGRQGCLVSAKPPDAIASLVKCCPPVKRISSVHKASSRDTNSCAVVGGRVGRKLDTQEWFSEDLKRETHPHAA